jgi:hypothetical protein
MRAKEGPAPLRGKPTSHPLTRVPDGPVGGWGGTLHAAPHPLDSQSPHTAGRRSSLACPRVPGWNGPVVSPVPDAGPGSTVSDVL